MRISPISLSYKGLFRRKNNRPEQHNEHEQQPVITEAPSLEEIYEKHSAKYLPKAEKDALVKKAKTACRKWKQEAKTAGILGRNLYHYKYDTNLKYIKKAQENDYADIFDSEGNPVMTFENIGSHKMVMKRYENQRVAEETEFSTLDFLITSIKTFPQETEDGTKKIKSLAEFSTYKKQLISYAEDIQIDKENYKTGTIYIFDDNNNLIRYEKGRNYNFETETIKIDEELYGMETAYDCVLKFNINTIIYKNGVRKPQESAEIINGKLNKYAVKDKSPVGNLYHFANDTIQSCEAIPFYIQDAELEKLGYIYV